MPYGFSSAAGQQMSLKPSGKERSCELFLQGTCKSLLPHRDRVEVSYGHHGKPCVQGGGHFWQAFPPGKKSPTTKCFLLSGSETALEKINTLLPSRVLHATVSLR